MAVGSPGWVSADRIGRAGGAGVGRRATGGAAAGAWRAAGAGGRWCPASRWRRLCRWRGVPLARGAAGCGCRAGGRPGGRRTGHHDHRKDDRKGGRTEPPRSVNHRFLLCYSIAVHANGYADLPAAYQSGFQTTPRRRMTRAGLSSLDWRSLAPARKHATSGFCSATRLVQEVTSRLAAVATMRIGLAQIAPELGVVEANFTRHAEMSRRLAARASTCSSSPNWA